MKNKENDIVFSIIIPVYNSELLISRCVDSIQATKNDTYEMIIVDDGSKDNSLNKCKELMHNDTRISVYSQINTGPLCARLNGVRHSRGAYICFIDSDDYISNDYFDVLKKEVDLKNPDIIYFDYFTDNCSCQNIDSESKIMIGSELVSEIYTQDHFHSLWRACFRKEFLNVDIPSELLSLKRGEDFLSFLFYVANSKHVLLIPNKLYFYCDNPNSLTKANNCNDYFQEIFEKERLGYEYLKRLYSLTQTVLNNYLLLSLKHCLQIIHFLFKSNANKAAQIKISNQIKRQPYFNLIIKQRKRLDLYNKIYLNIFILGFFRTINTIERIIEAFKR